MEKRDYDYKHVCEWCGRMFHTKYRKARFCSHDCELRSKNLGKQKGKTMGKTIIKTTYEKVCPECGKIFKTTKEDGKYCTDECFKKAQKRGQLYMPRKKRDDNSWRIETRTCRNCGRDFKPYDQYQQYCTYECSEEKRQYENAVLLNQAMNRKALEKRTAIRMGSKKEEIPEPQRHIYRKTCVVCGKEFDSDAPGTRYCSEECREASAKERARKAKLKTCPVCGKPFEKSEKANAIYCSEACMNEARQSNIKDTEMKSEGQEMSKKMICKHSGDGLCNLTGIEVDKKICNPDCTFFDVLDEEERMKMLEAKVKELSADVALLKEQVRKLGAA